MLRKSVRSCNHYPIGTCNNTHTIWRGRNENQISTKKHFSRFSKTDYVIILSLNIKNQLRISTKSLILLSCFLYISIKLHSKRILGIRISAGPGSGCYRDGHLSKSLLVWQFSSKHRAMSAERSWLHDKLRLQTIMFGRLLYCLHSVYSIWYQCDICAK